jgi:hypothetical protein
MPVGAAAAAAAAATRVAATAAAAVQATTAAAAVAASVGAGGAAAPAVARATAQTAAATALVFLAGQGLSIWKLGQAEKKLDTEIAAVFSAAMPGQKAVGVTKSRRFQTGRATRQFFEYCHCTVLVLDPVS